MENTKAYLTPSYETRVDMSRIGYVLYMERCGVRMTFGFYPVKNVILDKTPNPTGDVTITISDSQLLKLAEGVADIVKSGGEFCGFKYVDHDSIIDL